MNIGVFTLVGCTELTRMKCWPKFDGEGAHQADHAVLGRDVVAGVRVGLQPAHRAGQDDRSAPPARESDAAQPAFTVFHTPERLTSIMSCQSASLVLSSVWPPLPIPALAHDDVQPAQLLDPAVDRGLERVVVADIDLGGHDPAVEALDQFGGLGQVVRRGRRDLRYCC